MKFYTKVDGFYCLLVSENEYRTVSAYAKNAWAKIQIRTNATPMITASSGLTLMPLVSSSKNLNKPALWAGIGDFLSRFFSLLLLMVVVSLALIIPLKVLLIKVVLSFFASL